MRIILPVLTLGLALLLSGCGTLLSGTDDGVTIESDPSADAQIDGRATYLTPTNIDLDRDDRHIVRFQKEGYKEHAVPLEKGLNWGGLAANLIAAGLFEVASESKGTGIIGLLGIPIDFLTGAAYRVSPDDIDVELEQLPPERVASSNRPPTNEPRANETRTDAQEPSVVDSDIPETSMDRPDAIAVVIGVKEYEHPDVPDVEYGVRDAQTMKKYLTRTLGFREENIIYVENAGGSDMTRIFGTASSPKGQLYDWVKPGQSDVFVYYSGHGAPNPESGDAYFIPSDTNPNYLSQNGYPVDQLYQNLGILPAASVTVVLEACFSGVSDGGAVVSDISPAVLNVENPIVGMEHGLAFTAGAADQVSTWYNEKRHGLFTYYFLNGLRGAADTNNDRSVTASEMESYLTNEVPYRAQRMHSRKQTPQVVGQNKERVLVQYEGPMPVDQN